MFKHLFSTMNEVLEEIQKEYPNSDVEKKAELDEQLQVLKTMSDEFIEAWLLFEEKLGKFYGAVPMSTQTLHDELMELDVSGKQTDEFMRGQGLLQTLYVRSSDQRIRSADSKAAGFLVSSGVFSDGSFAKRGVWRSVSALQVPSALDRQYQDEGHFIQRNGLYTSAESEYGKSFRIFSKSVSH